MWALAALVVGFVLVKTFVADVYRVRSGSMEPTLFGGGEHGETVLVRFDGSPDLERFDLVVVERPGQPEPTVKRVVGLPGETVSIAGGDLVIDGARLPWDAPRPPFVDVVDEARTSLDEVFWFRRGEGQPWSRRPDAWVVDAREVPEGSNAGMMLLAPDLRDDYLDPAGERHGGLHQVGDGIVEVDLLAPPGEGRVRMMLVEQGDTFDALLHWGSEGGTRASIQRWVADDPPDVLEEVDVSLAPDEWHRLRFRNVDNALVLERLTGEGSEVLAAHGYASNQAYQGVVAGGDGSIGARVGFGAEGLVARFRNVRVARDLHYTDQGEYAVEAPLTLGLDEYFLLGDNSADSRDSRFWGPVPASALVGRPVAVVRPWDRRRWL